MNVIVIQGRIALIRYGKIYRGDKVREAEKRGAIGAILYSDPADAARLGTESGKESMRELKMDLENFKRWSYL
jgi:hypothetical protein